MKIARIFKEVVHDDELPYRLTAFDDEHINPCLQSAGTTLRGALERMAHMAGMSAEELLEKTQWV
jgi:hypothetical protein